jgi:hypothetical protein
MAVCKGCGRETYRTITVWTTDGRKLAGCSKCATTTPAVALFQQSPHHAFPVTVAHLRDIEQRRVNKPEKTYGGHTEVYRDRGARSFVVDRNPLRVG